MRSKQMCHVLCEQHKHYTPTDFTDHNLYCIKGALALFVLVSFFSSYVC